MLGAVDILLTVKKHQSFFGDSIIDDAILCGIGVTVENDDLFCLTVKEE